MWNNLDIENYIIENSSEEDKILHELNRETHQKAMHPRMLSGHIQGLILGFISQMVRPESILEIGTYTGYSAICLAKGLKEGGKIRTIEIDDELESMASKYFVKAGIQNKVIQLIGSAVDIIPTIDTDFDLVFIDADKREYTTYYDLIFEKVKPNGYILADNTLWGGKVVEELDPSDEHTKSILAFNKMIKNDSRVEKVILPFRDGMTLIRKK